MVKLIQDNIGQIRSLLQNHDVVEAYLFGSATNQHFSDDSDIDLLVDFKDKSNIEKYGNNYFNLLYKLQDLLKREVDLVAKETLQNPYLIQSIDASKIQLL